MRTLTVLAVMTIAVGGLAFGTSQPDELSDHAEVSVPDWWTDRVPMPSCGRFEPDDIRFDDPDLDEANACLRDAFQDGDPAELVYTDLTEEGDPTTQIYRVIGPQELEVMLDSREDDHSTLAFGHMVCDGLVEQELTIAPLGCEASDDRRVPAISDL